MKQHEAAVWQVLRSTYLRLLCQREGRNPARLAMDEANLILDPHLKELEHDFKLIVEVLNQAQSSGISHVHSLLHKRPGVDSEMLDQAVEFATLDLKKEREED